MKRHLMDTVGLLVLTLAVVAPGWASASAEGLADLQITHVHSPHAVEVGQLVTFRIVARNNGPDASQLDVIVELSSNLELVEMTCDNGVSADTPACEYSEVAPHRSTTTLVVARVTGEPDSTFSLTASVSNEDATLDPDVTNNVVTVGGLVR